MTRVYGTGTYDFRRHRVAEYPVESKAVELSQKPGGAAGGGVSSTITLSEIQRDRITKIAEANWLKTGDAATEPKKKPFDPELVKKIYETELLVKEGQKPVPLQRVMILEVSQYLENYLWPNFDPQSATFEHVMSMILMVNEKVLLFHSLVKVIIFIHSVLSKQGLVDALEWDVLFPFYVYSISSEIRHLRYLLIVFNDMLDLVNWLE